MTVLEERVKVDGTETRGRHRKSGLNCIEKGHEGVQNWRSVGEDRRRWHAEIVESTKNRLGKKGC